MNERTILIAALERDDPAERAAYLDDACAGDPALRRRLETMLRAVGAAPPAEERPQPAVGPRRVVRWAIVAATVVFLTVVALAVTMGKAHVARLFGGGSQPVAAGGDKPAPEPDADPQALAHHAGDILRANCHRCHGQDGVMEGGFNYVLDRERLTAWGKIVPGQPDKSPLLRRLFDGEMPPDGETPRPSPEDVAVLRRWVEAGAPDFAPSAAPRQPVLVADLPKLVRDDLARLPERDRRFARYFTLAHLHNAGLAADEMATYRQALGKLVNSLSWGREIVLPRPVDPDQTVLRIDLRDYKWDGAAWERLLAEYPYGRLPDGDAERDLSAATESRLPYLRADWFTATASRPPLYYELLQMPSSDREADRPPLYYELLQMPSSDREAEALFRVDAAQDIRAERVVRAGFSNSGVSRNNRVIERHESGYGVYWKSYDFAGATGPRSIFANPMGPAAGAHAFQPDGGEMIFELPNGLHAYFLTDGGGKRLDQAPVTIVSDPKRPERAVVAGASCMSCHARGFNDKADQIRDHVLKNPGAFPRAEADAVLALYPPRERFEALLRGDNDRYRRALEKSGARWGASDPIESLAARFDADVDLSLAAAEVGVSKRELTDALAGSPELGRALGALRADGGSAPRRAFADSFGDLLHTLRLGEPLRPGGLPPATVVKERTVVDLPEAFDEVKTGGGGRFLIFYLKKAKKLAVFDVFQARIIHQIDMPAEEVRYAAGRDKLLVVLPGEKIVQRWDLRTFEREKVAPVPGGVAVRVALMGYASQGPLALWSGGKVIFMDVGRMEPLEIEGPVLAGEEKLAFNLRVSADGQTFAGWFNDKWNSPFFVMHLDGRKAVTRTFKGDNINERWAIPNFDGSQMILHTSRVTNADLQPYLMDSFDDWVLLPTTDPGLFLAAQGTRFSVCAGSDRRRVFTITDKALEGMNSSSMRTRWFLIDRAEPRIHYVPEANVAAILPMNNKQVVVLPLNLIDELEKQGQEYLFVLSLPKTHVKAGGPFAYQMAVKSKSAGVTYKLDKGPEGMTVSSGGEVRWNAPSTQVGKTHPVIVTVSNASGKEVFHTFEIVVE
jgi:hypothetical protein